MVIPGRAEGASPESITTILRDTDGFVFMNSGLLAALGPGMTARYRIAPQR